ncbi:MAG: tRNA lysidine(34) synthetase TilS [Clostridia bacterium]|nr:tRNA lysidine(34) synthetase TilS [Clostridia bacterium]
MKNKAYSAVKKYNMLQKNDTVIVGLSGGADSTALLHFLLSIKGEFNLRIIACHINHMLRGDEADSDENFVRKICNDNSVELRVLRVDIHKEAQKRKIGTEECGRQIRYEFFEKTAAEFNAKIATAHTASDNAETVIFNMTRGCGIKGLCGIPPVRDNIIRPLIEVTRTEIEEYCRTNGYDFVTDSTNFERDYTRNRIRLDVIPVLKNINPSLESTIARMSAQMRQNEKFITDCAEKALANAKTSNGYRTDILSQLDDTPLSAALNLLVKKYNIIPESKHIELIREIVYNSGAVNLKNNMTAVSKQGFLRIISSVKHQENEIIPYNDQNFITINNKKISLLKMNIDEFNKYKKINNLVFNNSMDYDTIPSNRVFRTRKSGDVFTLPRRNVTKSLKKYFIELRIPQEKRDGIILFASGSDILWIEGTGVSKNYRVSENTKTVLVLEIQK